jgi:hypothetical protein
LKVPAATAVSTMSLCAEPATAGTAIARTLKINARLDPFKSSLLYLLVLCFSVALLLPFYCINYREQIFAQHEKKRNLAIHVSSSQKFNQLLYSWEIRRSGWSTKQLSKGFGPMLWGRNGGAYAFAKHGAGGIGHAHLGGWPATGS